MRESLQSLLLLGIAIQFAGCAGWLKDQHAKFPMSDHYQMEAMAYEDNGELQRALFYWRIVRELNPDDEHAAGRVAQLKAMMENMAEIHFKRAVVSYKKGSFETARKEFLIALRYNPTHKDAFDYLKNRLTDSAKTTYTVEEGDTFTDIARKVYRDPEKDFLVAYFMDGNTTAKPLQGAVTHLPVLEPELSEQLIDVVEKLNEARELFKDKDYEKVLTITEQILDFRSENKEAADLRNASYFQIGKKLRMKRKYSESLKMFNKVDPEYEGVKESISAVNRKMIKQAELHYRKGVKHFVDEDLEKAIEEWEKTLDLNPGHQKAKQDIENARILLEKWKKIK
jgi:tetratricopeptide (TPR) repeat protein